MIVGQNYVCIILQLVDLFSAENGYHGLIAWTTDIRILLHLKLISDVTLVFVCSYRHKWVFTGS